MVTKRKSLIIIGAAVVLLFVATAATIVFAETYNMTGTISAIDLQY
jgi:capsular polysaccharide biosynthesis protein